MSQPTSVNPAEVTVSRQAWLALVVTTLVTFLVVIDISAVNVAFPSIREDFDVSRSQLSWMISGYNIMVGALLMVSGRLADSIGRLKVFLPGVAIFGVGSLLSGLAPSVEFLIAARLLQGLGGAVLSGSSFAVMLPEFPTQKRSTAIGLAGATGSLGAVVGPVIGSILIDLASWRAIFLINVPLCLLAIFLGPRLLNESRDPDATGRIDFVGVPIGTAAVALVMFGIVQSESWGIADPRVIGFVVVGLMLFPILIRRSRTHPEPLINLDLFKYKSFTSANMSVGFYGLAFTSGFLLNSLVLQDLWDQPIRTVGLALMPSPLIAGVVSPLSGRYADRYGHRWILGIGCLLCAVGYALFLLLLDATPRVWSLYVPASVPVGIGVGLTVATWSSAGLSDIPEAKFGVAAATYNTLRQAAYAVGIAVVVTLISVGTDAELTGYRWAWTWVLGCYVLSGLVVMATFPSGSSNDRAES